MKLSKLFLRIVYKLMSIPYYAHLKKGVTKNDFSIIANDCCGGIIYHRIGKQFCSPFINLFIEHDDYILLLSNLEYFLSQELKEFPSEQSYPIGLLGKEKQIKINFMHYKNFADAKDCWEKRKKRLLLDKLIVILNLTNYSDENRVNEYISKLEKLNYENYLVFSRFNSNNPNVIKIDFSDLKTIQNAAILAPQKYPFRLHIDQINYKKVFKRFD